MKSNATTIAEHLASLPEDRRKVLTTLRAFVNKHVPKGYEEMLQFGAISWAVPLKVYPDTYNKQALTYVALGSQKNHMALYLMCAYGSDTQQKRLADGFKAAGKKLDMGKACLRFKSLEDLALEPIAQVIAAVLMPDYIAIAKAAHAKPAKRPAATKKSATKKLAKKKAK